MKRTIITIGREYGSGGREIGRKLAESLNIPCYDRELIEMAAKEGGIHSDVAANVDEKPTSSLLYSLATGSALIDGIHYSQQTELPLNDKLYIASAKVIRDLAKKGSCVIIGRCADYVLEKDDALISVYLYAPKALRAQRITTVYGIEADKADKLLDKMDRQRASYYSYYTSRKWKDMTHYDLCINSGTLGIDGTVAALKEYILLHANGD